MGERRGVRRVTLREAADALGISKDAVRQRIRRKSIRSDKGEDGRVYVYLDAYADDVHRAGARDPDVVDELRDRVRYLERQVEEEREARRRADTLLARLMDRVPELEAPQEGPQEPLGATERAAEGEGRDTLSDTSPGQERTLERRPWWRRVFGVRGE